MGMGAGAAGVGDVTDRDGEVGDGEVGLAGAEEVLDPRLPEEERPPPALAKTSSGIRKQRKKNSVKSISPLNTQRFIDITPPEKSFFSFISLISFFAMQIKHSFTFCNLTGALFIESTYYFRS
jgi:hypothetical protein